MTALTEAEIIIYSILEVDVNAESTSKPDEIDKSDEDKTNSHKTGLIFIGIGIALLVIGAIVIIVISKAENRGHVNEGKLFGNAQEILYFV